MRVLVTGATGYVGPAVVQELIAAGHEVLAASRGGKAVGGARGVRMDVTDADGTRGALQAERPDAVVHLVGIIEERGDQTFERVHVEGTRNVLRGAPPGTRVVHMSALNAREDAPSGYGSTKGRAERLVRESGLTFTILRPSLIFGPGSDFFGRVLRSLVTAPVVPVIGDGSFPFRPVSLKDVAVAFTRALERPAAQDATFDLTGPDEFTFRELLRLEMKALGVRRPMLPVPVPVMNVLVPAMQVLPRPPITRDQYLMLLEGSTADPEPARRAFDLPMLRLEPNLPQAAGKVRGEADGASRART